MPAIAHVRSVALVVVCSGVLVSAAHSQACHGTPSGGGIGYEYGKMTVGTSQGIAGTLAGNRTALGAGFAVRDLGDLTGQQGSLRFSLLFPAGKLLICPGLGLIYQHDTWKPRDDASLTAHNLSARGGVGLGFEQQVARGFSIIPFVVAQYEFAISVYDINLSGADSATTQLGGDTLSRAQFEYGLIGRYRFLYAGVVANRSSESKGGRPDMARWIIGVTFSGGNSPPQTPRPSRRVSAAPSKVLAYTTEGRLP